jgi:hypothetical protein
MDDQIRLPDNFSFGDFQQRRHRNLVRAGHPGRTAPRELGGSKASHDDEFECTEFSGTLHHNQPPFLIRANGERADYPTNTM